MRRAADARLQGPHAPAPREIPRTSACTAKPKRTVTTVPFPPLRSPVSSAQMLQVSMRAWPLVATSTRSTTACRSLQAAAADALAVKCRAATGDGNGVIAAAHDCLVASASVGCDVKACCCVLLLAGGGAMSGVPAVAAPAAAAAAVPSGGMAAALMRSRSLAPFMGGAASAGERRSAQASLQHAGYRLPAPSGIVIIILNTFTAFPGPQVALHDAREKKCFCMCGTREGGEI